MERVHALACLLETAHIHDSVQHVVEQEEHSSMACDSWKPVSGLTVLSYLRVLLAGSPVEAIDESVCLAVPGLVSTCQFLGVCCCVLIVFILRGLPEHIMEMMLRI